MGLPAPEAVAHEFSRVLREWLTHDEINEAIERNRVEESEGVCHSHDHCDANMAMEAAMQCFGLDIFSDNEEDGDPLVEEHVGIWNAAWAIAKASEFAIAGELEPLLANDALGG